MNLRVRDDDANQTFKLENYVITVTVDSPSGYDTVVVTGKVYHPDHGFVVVSTPTPMQFVTEELDSAPWTGVALLAGAAGTAGSSPTTATFTFIDSMSYRAEVDTDSDGSTDVTWNCTWEPDECNTG